MDNNLGIKCVGKVLGMRVGILVCIRVIIEITSRI